MNATPQRAEDLGRIMVFSPHLDDAVFSCGEMLAAAGGAVVVTAFAGTPQDAEMRTEWDIACGFASARDAVEKRREEDRAALAELHATPVWLDFCDSQYRQTPEPAQLAAALMQTVRQYDPHTLLMPAGLFHSDHVLLHRAALLVRRDAMQRRWLMYEDVPYRRIEGLLQQRLSALIGAGVAATPIVLPHRECMLAKRAAARRYASQLQGLAMPGKPGHADLDAPERYWRLDALPASPVP
jgi:LmbE family N-acetylglucosaminyl deacetylase